MSSTNPQKRTTNKNAKYGNEPKKPLSSKGCMLISIAIVVVFFVIYYFIGVISN